MDRLTTQDDLQAGARWAPALRALGDERLARMVENGSDRAFTAIYGRYAPILHGYCRSLLRDDEEAGDALQNAMLKALQAMRRSGRSGPLRPWLFRIAHNESITIIRARRRRPGPLDESMVHPTHPDDAFRHAVAREQLAALLADLENLTEHQRGALVMRELGGLSYDEIGEALETTPLAARQAVFVARKRLAGGPIAPRRLRPALRQLIPPAPAGFAALFGVLGGGASAGKALVGAAALVSVGVGSVELVTTPAVVHRARHQTVASVPHHAKRHAKVRAAVATPAARPATHRAAAASATAAPAAARHATAKRTATFVEAAATTTAVPKATATPAPHHIAAPPHSSEHASRPPARAPPTAIAADPAPATTPPPERRPLRPPPPSGASPAARQHQDCPHGIAPADDPSAGATAAPPVR